MAKTTNKKRHHKRKSNKPICGWCEGTGIGADGCECDECFGRGSTYVLVFDLSTGKVIGVKGA